MVKIQQCKFSCGKLITVQMDPTIGKYVPFEVDLGGNPTNKHNCPNSEYNRQNQQNQVTESAKGVDFNKLINNPQQQTATDKPSLEAILLNQLSQSITEQKNINATNHIAFAEKLETLNEIVKNSNIMLEAIVAHLKLTEPRKASELYPTPDQDKVERERAEIAGWNSKEKEDN